MLLKGCRQVEHNSESDYVKEFYGDDINYSDLVPNNFTCNTG